MPEESTGVKSSGTADLNQVYDRDDLPADGEGDEVVTQGMLMALMNLVRSLKSRRESMGLTIDEVARRSRLTPVTISRLENLHSRNPTQDTVYRYAMALDILVTLGAEEIEPDDELTGCFRRKCIFEDTTRTPFATPEPVVVPESQDGFRSSV